MTPSKRLCVCPPRFFFCRIIRSLGSLVIQMLWLWRKELKPSLHLCGHLTTKSLDGEGAFTQQHPRDHQLLIRPWLRGTLVHNQRLICILSQFVSSLSITTTLSELSPHKRISFTVNISDHILVAVLWSRDIWKTEMNFFRILSKSYRFFFYRSPHASLCKTVELQRW